MESKFILFAVLVTLSYISSALSSTPFGLSEEQTNGLSELRELRNSALSARYDGHNLIYDMIEHIFNRTASTPVDNSSTIFADALPYEKIGVDCILDSIPIALRKPCDGIETTRDAIHANIDEVYSLGARVLGLALSGDYFENQAELEGYRARAQTVFENFEQAIFNLLRTCRNTTDADTLAAIEAAENGATTGVLNAAGAVFKAIEILAIAVTTGNTSLALLSDIEEYRSKTLIGLRDETFRECAVLEALYIAACMGQPGIVSVLAADRFTTMMTIYLFTDLSGTIFNEIINSVNRTILGVYDDGEVIFPPTDAAEAKVAGILFSWSNFTLESILFIYPEKSDAAADARELFTDMACRLSAIYFLMIKVAQNQGTTDYSEVVAELSCLKSRLTDVVDKYLDIIFALLRNEEIWNDEIEIQFTSLEDRAHGTVHTYADLVQNATEILAKATHDNGAVGTDDICAIQDALARGISVSVEYTQLASEAYLALFLLASDEP